MKKYLFLIIFLAINSSFTLISDSELIIEVTGINTNKKGNLRIGIFKKDGFPEAGKVHLGKVIPVTNEIMKISFNKLNVGIYGIAVIQDQDKNGKLSTNFVGYPTEPYGFSNNKFGRLGPPDFNDISFTLKSGQSMFLKINLK
jgi:uncharacterized protein (DUF2141 family)